MMKIKRTIKSSKKAGIKDACSGAYAAEINSPPNGGPALVSHVHIEATGRVTDRPSPAPRTAKAEPASPYTDYEMWSAIRLTENVACWVEPSMDCLPLQGDPICTACYEGSDDASQEVCDD